MNTFNEILWWVGTSLFVVGVIGFYSTLLYKLIKDLKG